MTPYEKAKKELQEAQAKARRQIEKLEIQTELITQALFVAQAGKWRTPNEKCLSPGAPYIIRAGAAIPSTGELGVAWWRGEKHGWAHVWGYWPYPGEDHEILLS